MAILRGTAIQWPACEITVGKLNKMNMNRSWLRFVEIDFAMMALNVFFPSNTEAVEHSTNMNFIFR